MVLYVRPGYIHPATICALLLALSACDGTGPSDNPGPPASIAIFEGNEQQAPVGQPVSTPPAVLVTDSDHTPVRGVAVTFQVVSGGGTITAGSTVTDITGVARVGSWTLGSAGQNLLRATAEANGVSGNPVTFSAATAGSFNIEIRFLGGGGSQTQHQAVAQAQARWEDLVTGDQEDIPLTSNPGECGTDSPAVNETVDDLLIFVTLETIDGPGGVLASAGPCFIRNSNQLPVLGSMRFDSEDLQDLETEGLLFQVILHEMGHVLGFGSIWGAHGLLADPSASGGTDPHFTGPQAIAAFNEVGGAAYTAGQKVPVENVGGEGRADGHWRESVFGNELMTGLIDPGQNPLSRVTIASLADLGYTVNLGGADAFSLSLAFHATGGRRSLELGNDLLGVPLKKIDAKGRFVGLLQR